MDSTLYRKWIREALATASPFAMPAKVLHDAVAEIAGGRFDLSDYRRGIEWNLARDYVRSSVNPDTDQTEWRLTKLGEAKQTGDE